MKAARGLPGALSVLRRAAVARAAAPFAASPAPEAPALVCPLPSWSIHPCAMASPASYYLAPRLPAPVLASLRPLRSAAVVSTGTRLTRQQLGCGSPPTSFFQNDPPPARGLLHVSCAQNGVSWSDFSTDSRGQTQSGVGEREQSQDGSESEHPARMNTGSIHLIVGPMFSGKTTELLRRVASAKAEGREVLLVKSHVDTRYAENEVVSHTGHRMKCLAVTSMAEIPRTLGRAAYRKVDVIGVDEGQFIKDLEFFSTNAADHEGKTIIVAGLDGDFMRRKFGGLVDLIPVADTVTKLHARCQVCSEPAVFTLRKSDDLRTELIGGADIYMPVCRAHYLGGKTLVHSFVEGHEVEAESKETVPRE